MQLRLFAALIVFVGSYLPLSAILLVQDVDGPSFRIFLKSWWSGQPAFAPPLDHPAWSIAAFSVCVSCFIATFAVLRALKKKITIVVINAKYIPADLINYTFPYIVSFMGVDYGEKHKLAGMTIFLIWLFWITFRSGQIALNPVLMAAGWRLYEISYSFAGDNRSYTGIALSKHSVSSGQRYRRGTLQDVLVVEDASIDGDPNGGSG